MPIRPHRGLAVALVAGAFAVSLAAAEVFVRFVRPSPYYGYRYTRPQQKLFEYDPTLGWRGRPHASEIFAGADYYCRVTHNARGHRSSTEPAVAGKRNVVVVGDSFGWGWGVEDDEVFAERMMQAEDSINVYNLCAPAYGTDQSLLTLERLFEEEASAPFDHVLALVFHNDFDENLTAEARGMPKPAFVLEDGELRLTNTPVPQTMRRQFDIERRLELDREPGLLARSHLFNLAWLAFRPRPGEDEPGGRSPVEPAADSEQSAELAFALLDRMRRVAEARGARFTALFVFPRDSEPRWAMLAKRLDEAGVRRAVFAPWSVFRTTLWLDGHLNEYGNRLLARTALDLVAERPAR